LITRGLKTALLVVLLVLSALMACSASASMKGPRQGAALSASHGVKGSSTHSEAVNRVPLSPVSATLYGFVRLYQKTFSNLKWSNCQFSPSCSNYAQQALVKNGGMAGLAMAGDRLIRCNRWAWNSGIYEVKSDGHLHDPVTGDLLWAVK
jgi:putative membrane protein insertion efficiency factor